MSVLHAKRSITLAWCRRSASRTYRYCECWFVYKLVLLLTNLLEHADANHTLIRLLFTCTKRWSQSAFVSDKMARRLPKTVQSFFKRSKIWFRVKQLSTAAIILRPLVQSSAVRANPRVIYAPKPMIPSRIASISGTHLILSILFEVPRVFSCPSLAR